MPVAGTMRCMTSERRTRDPLLLLTGAVVAAAGLVLVVRSGLGLGPWAALADGLAAATGLSVGVGVLAVAAIVLLVDAASGRRVGIATVVAVGALAGGTELGLMLVPQPASGAIELRCALLVAGVLAIALALAMTDRPGPRSSPADPWSGPRSGFAGWTGIELPAGRVALACGALIIGGSLGAVVNLGSVLAAVAIGPIARRLAPRFSPREDRTGSGRATAEHPVGSLAWGPSDSSSPWSPPPSALHSASAQTSGPAARPSEPTWPTPQR